MTPPSIICIFKLPFDNCVYVTHIIAHAFACGIMTTFHALRIIVKQFISPSKLLFGLYTSMVIITAIIEPLKKYN